MERKGEDGVLATALSQDGFGKWGRVVLAFVPWRDVVRGLAATSKPLQARLKTHFKLRYCVNWQQAVQYGWCRITEAVVDFKEHLVPPPLHVETLTCCDAFLTYRPAQQADRIVFPAVRSLRILADADARATARQADKLMTAAKARSLAPPTAVALWESVVEQSSWRCLMPKLEALSLDVEFDFLRGLKTDFDFVTSVLMSACFGPEAFAPPLQHLHLALPLPNDEVSVHVMSQLALSLRSLSAALVLPTKTKTSPWLWHVTDWPELQNLEVHWHEDERTTPAQIFTRLHAPHLRALRMDGWSPGEMSPQTLSSLRAIHLNTGVQHPVKIDLGHLPNTITRLTVRARTSQRVTIKSLPRGLRDFAVSEDAHARVSLSPRVTTPILLSALRRFDGPILLLSGLEAPCLREVVWRTNTKATADTVVPQVCAQVKHVTFVMTFHGSIQPVLQPFVTRIQLWRGVEGLQYGASWLQCDRLVALHLPHAREQFDVDVVREWALQHGYRFSTRACENDSEEEKDEREDDAGAV